MKEDNMMYLIIEETHYDNIDNSYIIEDTTNDYNKAIDMLQGYKLINKREDRTYCIVKYDSPLLLTKEMEC